MKENLLDQEKASSLEALKSELFVGLKDREAHSSKLRFGTFLSYLLTFLFQFKFGKIRNSIGSFFQVKLVFRDGVSSCRNYEAF